MALIKCPECGKKVSNQAQNCPNCGHPISTIGPTYQAKQTAPQITQNTAKPNRGCLVPMLIVIFLFGIGLAFGISQIIQHPEDYQKKEQNITMIFDSSKFSRISTETLIEELGEAKRIEDWTNSTSKGEFAMQIYSYDFDDYIAEFILYENTVVKVRLFANSKWQIEGSSFDNIFAMFGVTPDENARKTFDNGYTYKFSSVSNKVARIEFYNYDKKDKSFDTVYITYNSNYFD